MSPLPISSQPTFRHIPTARRQAGLSMVEVMIALTIGLILLAGVATLIYHQNMARTELEKTSRQIENGRYAMQLFQADIQHAGFYGQYSTLNAPAVIPDPCAATLATINPETSPAIMIPVQGYTSLPTALSTCLSSGNYKSGTGILIVRRAETASIPVASAAAGQVYIQTTTAGYVIGTGSDTSVFTLKKKDGTTLADLRRLFIHVYFVSPCSVPASGTVCNGTTDDGGSPVPTLKRLELTVSGGVPAYTMVPLVEGIENVQFDYGIDTNSDGIPDSYTATGGGGGGGHEDEHEGEHEGEGGSSAAFPTDAATWGNVMAIRVNLLARNNEATRNYTDTKTYSLGGAGTVGPFNDHYKRHAYSELVRLNNPSGRREQP